MKSKSVLKTFVESLSPLVLIFTAIFFVYFVLFFGLPGIDYSLSHGMLYAIDHTDGAQLLKSGLPDDPTQITQDLVTDMQLFLVQYIGYLAIFLLLLYAGYVCIITGAWNYLEEKKLSLQGYWKVFWVKLLWVIVVPIVSLLVYGLFYIVTFVFSMIPYVGYVVMVLQWLGFIFILACALHSCLLLMQGVVETKKIRKTIVALYRKTKQHWKHYAFGQGIFFLLMVLITSVSQISFTTTYQAATTIGIVLLSLLYSWIHVYYAKVLSR